jgi:acetoin utilization deacetylase AcuC-like enzyme
MAPRKDRVSYFYDADVGSVYYGPNHPMKPHRLCMAHSLILGYGLHEKLEIYRPHKAYPQEFAQFHSTDYVEFLHRITPEMADCYKDQLIRCKCCDWRFDYIHVPVMCVVGLFHRLFLLGSTCLLRAGFGMFP